MPRNRARTRFKRPAEKAPKAPKLVSIGAKVDLQSFAIVDHAASIRGWPRSKVVELGALEYAQRIIEQAGANLAALRRMTRQSRSRQGGIAAAKRRK